MNNEPIISIGPRNHTNLPIVETPADAAAIAVDAISHGDSVLIEVNLNGHVLAINGSKKWDYPVYIISMKPTSDYVESNMKLSLTGYQLDLTDPVQCERIIEAATAILRIRNRAYDFAAAKVSK